MQPQKDEQRKAASKWTLRPFDRLYDQLPFTRRQLSVFLAVLLALAVAMLVWAAVTGR